MTENPRQDPNDSPEATAHPLDNAGVLDSQLNDPPGGGGSTEE